MSDYISDEEKRRILAQIANLQLLADREEDDYRRQEIINQINGLRMRLTYGANPDRGM